MKLEQAHIDLAPLAAAAGARLILAEATGIDLARREVQIAGRPPLPYDLLSIDVGGEPAIPEHSEGAGVKPIGRLRERLVALAEATPGRRTHRSDRWRPSRHGTGAGVDARLSRPNAYHPGQRDRRTGDPGAGACPPDGACRPGGCRRGTDQWRAGARARRGTTAPVGRQRDRGGGCPVGDRRDRSRLSRAIGAGLRCGRLRPGERDAGSRPAIPECLPPATAPPSTGATCPRPASGRYGPAGL